jgi:DivIVA domain-containing protein
MARFPVVLRGYERAQVDALLVRINGTLGRGSGKAPVEPVTADEVRGTRFDVVLRGYDQRAVDEMLQENIRELAATADRRTRHRRPVVGVRWLIEWIENAQFGSSGLRAGYDVRDVDAFLDRVIELMAAID